MQIKLTTLSENTVASPGFMGEWGLSILIQTDEQALIIQTAEGLIIVSGCAHRGIINTIRHAKKITGEKKIHTVIGGTHLYPKKQSDVHKTIAELSSMGIQHIGVSHCTGLNAAMQLSSALGERFFLNNTGCIHTLQFEN